MSLQTSLLLFGFLSMIIFNPIYRQDRLQIKQRSTYVLNIVQCRNNFIQNCRNFIFLLLTAPQSYFDYGTLFLVALDSFLLLLSVHSTQFIFSYDDRSSLVFLYGTGSSSYLIKTRRTMIVLLTDFGMVDAVVFYVLISMQSHKKVARVNAIFPIFHIYTIYNS